MKFTFEAIQLAISGQQEPVIDRQDAECADLCGAREKAKYLLMAAMVPGVHP
jgi:hypothetical protein